MNFEDNLEKFVEIQKQLIGSFAPTKKVVFNKGCALFGKGLKKKCLLSGAQFNRSETESYEDDVLDQLVYLTDDLYIRVIIFLQFFTLKICNLFLLFFRRTKC